MLPPGRGPLIFGRGSEAAELGSRNRIKNPKLGNIGKGAPDLPSRASAAVRVRGPIWPHVSTDEAALCADHSRAQRPDRRLVGQPIRVHDGAVIAPRGLAIDQQVAATVPAYVAERD